MDEPLDLLTANGPFGIKLYTIMEISYKKGSLTAEDISSIMSSLLENRPDIEWFRGVRCVDNGEKYIADQVAKAITEGGEFTIWACFSDLDEEKPIRVNYRDLENGARRMAQKSADAFLRIVQKDYDMWDASTFMQYVVYKAQIYE